MEKIINISPYQRLSNCEHISQKNITSQVKQYFINFLNDPPQASVGSLIDINITQPAFEMINKTYNSNRLFYSNNRNTINYLKQLTNCALKNNLYLNDVIHIFETTEFIGNDIPLTFYELYLKLLYKVYDFNKIKTTIDKINNFPQHSMRVVTYYVSKGKLDKAIEYFNEHVSKEKQTLELSRYWLSLLRKTFKFEDAFFLLNSIDFDNKSIYHYEEALIEDAKNNIDKAIYCINKSLEIDYKNLRFINYLCNLLQRKRDFFTLKKTAEKYIKERPDWLYGYIYLSFMHEGLGEIDNAIKDVKQAFKPAPLAWEYKFRLSTLLQKKGDFKQASMLIQNMIDLNSQWAEPYSHLSSIEEHKENIEQAIEFAKKAESFEPYSLSRKLRLISLFRKNNDINSAKNLVEKSLILNPYWGELYRQVAMIEESKHHIDTALESAKKAEKIEPYNLSIRIFLANLLRNNKNYDQLNDYAKNLILLHPFWAEPYSHLAYIQEKKGNIITAIDLMQKAVKIEPYNLRHNNYLSRLKKLNSNGNNS